eukprot:339967-Pyramimonas_sp.AAC.1
MYEPSACLAAVIARCRERDKKVRLQLRRDRSRRMGLYVRELEIAKSEGDMALCWKLSRLLAKSHLGPKQRNFCAPKTRLEMS